MTDDDIKDLIGSEKLNLILSELCELKTTVNALAVQVQKLQGRMKESKRQDDKPPSDEWLDYRDAAVMMGRPPGYFRRRDGLGDYVYWPKIERWQPGGRRTRLYVRREHVEAWIEA